MLREKLEGLITALLQICSILSHIQILAYCMHFKTVVASRWDIEMLYFAMTSRASLVTKFLLQLD